jgi:hypothetical protein
MHHEHKYFRKITTTQTHTHTNGIIYLRRYLEENK